MFGPVTFKIIASDWRYLAGIHQAKWRIYFIVHLSKIPSVRFNETHENRNLLQMKYWLSSLLLLALMINVACQKEEPPLPTARLSITATDIAYDHNQMEAVVGQPIRLTLVNSGTLEHDFTIATMPHSDLMVIDEMDDEMAGHDMANMGTEPDVHMAAPAGGQSTIEFTPTESGEYQFVCTVPGHQEAGMVGTLLVRAP